MYSSSLNLCIAYQEGERSWHPVRFQLADTCYTALCPTTEEILKVPSLLVGMEIRHRFEDEDGLTWYDGLVIGVANMEFEVIYSGEEDICEFDLLQDYMKSDLQSYINIILVIILCATATLFLYSIMIEQG